MHALFLDILVLFGIVLSCFLVFLIFSSKTFRNGVQIYFALSIISLSCWLCYTWFEDYVPANGVLEVISWDFLFPFAFLMYVLRAIGDPWGQDRRIWLLALPGLLLSLLQLLLFFLDFDPFDWWAEGDEATMEQLIEIRAFSFLPFALILTGLAHFKVSRAQQVPPPKRTWLRFNSLAIFLFLILWFFSDALAEVLQVAIWEYLLAATALFLIIVTYRGVHQLHLGPPKLPSPKPAANRPRISNRATQKVHKLQDLMDRENLYLDPHLSRSVVAQRLAISDGYLSEIMRTVLGTKFNDYINEFRVRTVIALFRTPRYDPFSLEAIGREAGFKSKSVFYNAFKKVTQKTPGSYRKTLHSS